MVHIFFDAQQILTFNILLVATMLLPATKIHMHKLTGKYLFYLQQFLNKNKHAGPLAA